MEYPGPFVTQPFTTKMSPAVLSETLDRQRTTLLKYMEPYEQDFSAKSRTRALALLLWRCQMSPYLVKNTAYNMQIFPERFRRLLTLCGTSKCKLRDVDSFIRAKRGVEREQKAEQATVLAILMPPPEGAVACAVCQTCFGRRVTVDNKNGLLFCQEQRGCPVQKIAFPK